MTLATALLVPLLVLMAVSLFAFAGCGKFLAVDPIPETPPPPAPPPTPTPTPDPTPTPTPAPTYSEVITAEVGLRGYWRLGEPPGTAQAEDSKPVVAMRRPGTYKQPGVALGEPGVLTLGKDPGDTAAGFAAPQGFVNIPFDVLVNPPLSFSIEAWVRPAMTAAGKGVVVGSYEALPAPRGFVLEVVRTATGNMKAQVRVGDDAQFTVLQTDLDDGSSLDGWMHLVATYDGPAQELTLYSTTGITIRVGKAPGAVGYTAVDGTNNSPFRIGVGRGENAPPTAGPQPAFHFNGRIDEVALYDRVLDAMTVATHFSKATTP